MLKTETIIINKKQYTRTWSDVRRMIERDGVRYEEAIDPSELERVYTETDEIIINDEVSDAEALAIITGEVET